MSRVKEGCVLGLAGAQSCPPSTKTNPRFQLLGRPGDLSGNQGGGQEGELFLLDTHLWVTEGQNKAPIVSTNNCPLLPPQASANKESSCAQQQVLALEQQCTEQIHALEAQLSALEKARAADHAAAERKVVSEERRGAGHGSTTFTCGSAAKLFDGKKTSPPLK